jgi:hypothetical protein
MPRAILEEGRSREILELIKLRNNLSWLQIANLCNISPRSLFDWRREKYKMPLGILEKLCTSFNLKKPYILGILSDNWGKVKGGKIAGNLSGCPATPEGRKKAILKRKSQRTPIIFPDKSQELAEFIGIMLGDGDISENQISVSLNLNDEQEYASFISDLINRLFGLRPSIHYYKSSGIYRVRVSSLNLIEYLSSIGLQRGKKTTQQFNIASWIIDNRELKSAFVRGMMDTEGSFYSYKHIVHNRPYENSALCFTNYSNSLVQLMFSTLKELGFNPRVTKNRIYLYRRKEIGRYFKEIGTHNPKHLQKYNEYITLRNS